MRPTSGEIIFDKIKLNDVSDSHLAKYRREKVGFVMQSFSLIPYLSAEKNIIVALNLQKNGKKLKKEKAARLLDSVGLGNRLSHFPRELSYGQQQRVAIARALANNPSIIFADEPTGNLDPAMSVEILNLLKSLNEEKQITIVMVTHSPQIAEYGKMRLHLNDGHLSTR
jgi:ABC-type lipoprotein export system ATPase subunit